MITETIYPPLTEAEFATLAVGTFRGIPLCEDEDAIAVYAFGHRDKAEFAAAVNDYDREMSGADVSWYTAHDVIRVWAVTLQPLEPDGWWVSWADEHQDHPQRFPMTVVNR